MKKSYQDVISWWRQKNIRTVSDLETVLSNFRIVFAYNSGAIENPQIDYHNTREIFENGKIVNFTGDLKTIFEIQNQKICYDFLKEKIIQKESMTPELVKSIHEKLMQGTYDEHRWNQGERPGEFKKHDYVVADDQGALPEEVAGEIEELCDELRDIRDKGENILKAAAYLHCKFENTHPFADGNGRVGRTLMNYFLMTHNYPPLVVYNESKDRYYQALGAYDKTGDISQFIEYMKQAMEKTWEINRAPENKLEKFLDR